MTSALQILQQLLPPRYLPGIKLSSCNLFGLVEIPSPAGLKVNLMQVPICSFERELVREIDDGKQRKQNIRVDKVSSVERGKRAPSLDKSQENVGAEPEVCIPGVPERLEGKLVDAVTLGSPGATETDVSEGDGAPDQKGRHTTQVDDVTVGLSGASADIHHGERAEEVCEDNSGDRDTAFVCPAEEARGFSVLGHEEDSTGADVNGAIDGGETGDENKGIDEMDASLPTGILNRNSHGTLDSSARAADKVGSIGRACKTEKEG